ncbi:MAG: nucleotidyl transferase AbiEii/AbiGii toxin family protein [Anaerolineales bacterium]|jgi:hypothetical protein
MAVLTSPHWETITEGMRRLLTWMGQQDFVSRFYLAGGTALALQIGHRRSMDLDFFSATDEVHEKTRQSLMRVFSQRQGQVIENVDGNLLFLVEGLNVGFFSYGYPLLEPVLNLEHIEIASLLDIGLMKLDALIGRGSRKDFYDLYFISQHLTLADLLRAGERKYPQARDFALMAVECLVMFENADRDHPPDLLVDLPWEQVKRFFIEQSKSFGNDWFGD